MSCQSLPPIRRPLHPGMQVRVKPGRFRGPMNTGTLETIGRVYLHVRSPYDGTLYHLFPFEVEAA